METCQKKERRPENAVSDGERTGIKLSSLDEQKIGSEVQS